MRASSFKVSNAEPKTGQTTLLQSAYEESAQTFPANFNRFSMAVPAWASVVIALGAAAIVAISAEYVVKRLTRKPFKPAGKHCFITGGSTGLGKALAIDLVKRGANVTIVARRQSELEKAAQEIEVYIYIYIFIYIYNFLPRFDFGPAETMGIFQAHKLTEAQRVVTVSADVTSKEDVVRAFDEAKVKMGADPDFVCACAGNKVGTLFLGLNVRKFTRNWTLQAHLIQSIFWIIPWMILSI